MNLTHVRLLVQDVAVSLAYYRDVLGLEVTLEAGDLYAELRTGGSILGIYRADVMSDRLGASRSDPVPPEPSDHFCLSFDVDDVDGTFDALVARGAVVAKPPHDHPEAFLRAAHIRDPDGNLIEINIHKEPG